MTAIGVVETLSIPMGVLAGDQMVKTAQVELVTAQTVCAGKYIVVVSGEVAAVREASVDQLRETPGVGPVTAQAIFAHFHPETALDKPPASPHNETCPPNGAAKEV